MTPDGSSHVAPELPGLTLLRQIGAGTFGEVWMAREQDETLRAVKLVQRDRFKEGHPYEREWRGHERFESLSRSHVGVVDVLRLERDDSRGLFFSVMELADDSNPDAGEINPETYQPRTLQAQLAEHGALPPAECMKVGVSLARALAHLHSHGLVHRDVKPSNIIYVNGKPKLADIGMVARMDSTPSALGTYGYIPYEGPGKPTADVFALGKVLYEMATGKDRYDFPELPAPNPELRGLNAIILKACADLPKERYANSAEMAEDLERVRDGHRPLEESTAVFNKLLVTVVVLFVGVLIWKNYSQPDAPDAPEPSWRRALSKAEVAQMYLDESVPHNRPAARWDFEYSYSYVLETNALRYLIRTNNVQPKIEWQKPPVTYWGPISNGEPAELVYHFPFKRPVRRAHLLCTVNTWDFSDSTAGVGRGAAAIGVSTNGTDWIPLRNGLEPVALWSADGLIDDELPARLMGATNYFIRVRMLMDGAVDPDYTPAQHSRMVKEAGGKGFEFKVEMGEPQ